MKFHLPSFLLGAAAGYAAKSVGAYFRPLVVEVAAAGYRLASVAAARAGRVREDLENALAEAKARVTPPHEPATAPSGN
jgi:hypothetical protein